MLIPTGFNTVTPYFIVEDAAALVTFLVDGLGGVEVMRHMRPDGAIANAQVRLGSSTMMVGEASEDFPGMRSSYYLYVDNADAAMLRALQAGATQVMAVEDKPYGDRQGGVKDMHGNLWWLSQRTVAGPY